MITSVTSSTALAVVGASLLQRVFAVDVLECRRCQGRMRVLAVIEQPVAVLGARTRPIATVMESPTRRRAGVTGK